MTQLVGQCHCGAVQVVLELVYPPSILPYRACQCSFCRAHGAATTSHPESHLHIEAAPGALSHYRFGRRAVDFLICRECGVYVASTIEADGERLATVNVAGLSIPGFEGRTPEPADYDHDTDDERLIRRQARWMPLILVETQPSA